MTTTPPPAPPPPPPTDPYAGTSGPMSPSDEKTWAIVIHVAGIFFGFIPPLIAYLVLKDRGPFIRAHTATALNFQVTIVIGYLASFLLAFVLIGLITGLAVWVGSIVFAIIAAIAANNGQYYRYPVAIPFVK